MSGMVMVLDSTYRRMSIVGWQRALTLVVSNKAEVLENTEKTIRTVRMEIPIPSVIRLLHKVMTGREPEVKFSRINVFKRDSFTCQYCGEQRSRKDLTLDHVLPKSRGGLNEWENVVTSCKSCNLKKGDRLLRECGMKLNKIPKKPSAMSSYVVAEFELAEVWRKYDPRIRVVTKTEYKD